AAPLRRPLARETTATEAAVEGRDRTASGQGGRRLLRHDVHELLHRQVPVDQVQPEAYGLRARAHVRGVAAGIPRLHQVGDLEVAETVLVDALPLERLAVEDERRARVRRGAGRS